MTNKTKETIRRFLAFSACNVPGTLVDLLVVWVCSSFLFGRYFGRYVLSPIISFELAMFTDFVLCYLFVWHDRISQRSGRSFLRHYIAYSFSTTGVFLLRIGIIQLMGIWALPVVICDLVAMIFSGLANFVIGEKVIFRHLNNTERTHRLGVRVLMVIVKPFVRLKVCGQEKIDKDEAPAVFVCNRVFVFGTIAATLNLPVDFRPWVHDVMLDRKQCSATLYSTFSKSLRFLNVKIRRKLLWRFTKPLIALLNDFNPIPVVRGCSHDIFSTLKNSLTALHEGDNLLIFPGRPHHGIRHNTNQGMPQAAQIQNFYMGFTHLGRMYYEQTGRCLRFYPTYVDRFHRVLLIGDPVVYQPSNDSREEKSSIAETLHTRLKNMAEECCLAAPKAIPIDTDSQTK